MINKTLRAIACEVFSFLSDIFMLNLIQHLMKLLNCKSGIQKDNIKNKSLCPTSQNYS
jgi:hypothetical protein